jgi:hypothetical protein
MGLASTVDVHDHHFLCAGSHDLTGKDGKIKLDTWTNKHGSNGEENRELGPEKYYPHQFIGRKDLSIDLH